MYLAAHQLSQCIFHPVSFSRKDAGEQCPWLIQIDDELLGHHHHTPHQSPLARACLALEGHVAPLLDYTVCAARPVVIISLPPTFETCIGEAACQAPAPYWTASAGLKCAMAFIDWRSPDNTWPFSFSICGDMYSKLLSWQEPVASGQGVAFPSRRQTVIMMSGNRVAVGGFWMSENNLTAFQACDAAVSSWNPSDDYTTEEIAAAAEDSMATGIEWVGLNYLQLAAHGKGGFTLGGYIDVRQDPVPNYDAPNETALSAFAMEEDI